VPDDADLARTEVPHAIAVETVERDTQTRTHFRIQNSVHAGTPANIHSSAPGADQRIHTRSVSAEIGVLDKNVAHTKAPYSTARHIAENPLHRLNVHADTHTGIHAGILAKDFAAAEFRHTAAMKHLLFDKLAAVCQACCP
jgi:hypothetical protein